MKPLSEARVAIVFEWFLRFGGTERVIAENGLERLNQEIKRSTRVVRIFPNPQTCLKLLTALAVEQSEEWVTCRRYLDMSELEEQRHVERES